MEKELENFIIEQYWSNKLIAEILRDARKFERALRYYAAAQIHLRYYKLITGNSKI